MSLIGGVHLEMITDSDRAYAAGLLDGEGSIVIRAQHVKKRQYSSFVLRVSITNGFYPIFDWLQARWGGHISWRNRAAPRRPCGDWILTSKAAAVFLLDVQPYVRIKHDQVKNGLSFQATKRGKGQSRRRLTASECNVGLEYVEQAAALNARSFARVGGILQGR